MRIRQRLRNFIDGIFCYVPGQSEPDPRMRSHWVIKADDGKLLSKCDLPGPLFPTGDYPSRFAGLSKRITFLRRRESGDPDPANLLPPRPHSLMYYRDGTEILVGDRIRFRSVFRGWRISEGTITYIPGLAPEDPDLCEGDWAIGTDDGWAFSGGLYWPGRVVGRLTFIRRAEGK